MFRASERFCLDFVAVGPARTATTWLHNTLRPHTNLPAVKETRFFDRYFRRGSAWYAAQFGETRRGLPTGEFAPTYFHSRVVRERINRFAPTARIICTLRDPVDRLYSLYRYKRWRINFSWSFEEAVERDEEMVESSRYVAHLTAWIEAFGPSNVLVILYDDINREPQACIDRICEFIGARPLALDARGSSRVNASSMMTAPLKYPLARGVALAALGFRAIGLNAPFRMAKWSGIKHLFVGNGGELPPLDPAFAAELRARFTPELARLEQVTGRDLSAWKAFRT